MQSTPPTLFYHTNKETETERREGSCPPPHSDGPNCVALEISVSLPLDSLTLEPTCYLCTPACVPASKSCPPPSVLQAPQREFSQDADIPPFLLLLQMHLAKGPFWSSNRPGPNFQGLSCPDAFSGRPPAHCPLCCSSCRTSTAFRPVWLL